MEQLAKKRRKTSDILTDMLYDGDDELNEWLSDNDDYLGDPVLEDLEEDFPKEK